MIKIKDLQKKYKGFELNISMEVPEGTVTGLIGRNGAGKSTTIKSVLGLIRPDDGEIRVMDKVPQEFTAQDREAIGAALSDSGFSMVLTIKDVIGILKGRVLTAMSHNAKLLVLDEPTAGLDVLARNDVLDLLRGYMEEDSSRSILISSHISSDLEGLCDDIYMINKGRIILHEDTDTILGQYGILKVSEDEYAAMDKQYVIAEKKDKFSHTCLTKEKQFYLDNYPNMVVENSSIDDMIVLMLGGKEK